MCPPLLSVVSRLRALDTTALIMTPSQLPGAQCPICGQRSIRCKYNGNAPSYNACLCWYCDIWVNLPFPTCWAHAIPPSKINAPTESTRPHRTVVTLHNQTFTSWTLDGHGFAYDSGYPTHCPLHSNTITPSGTGSLHWTMPLYMAISMSSKCCSSTAPLSIKAW